MDPIDNVIENLITTDSAKIVDDSLKGNAEFADRAGLEIRVTRVYDGVGLSRGRVCQWCKDRECRNATLQEAYDIGAFQRHPGCECVIEYVSRKSGKTYQSGKSGPHGWISEEEFQRRVNFGLNNRTVTPQERAINAAIEMQVLDKKSVTLVNSIIENHEALKYYTPEQMLKRLQNAGYNVKPLSRGAHKGELFIDGGGYKINFGGDGIFQYHPAENSHHGDAYWKIKHGKVGVWYDRQGKEIKRNQN